MGPSIKDIKEQLNEIVATLRERFPETLKAVIIYGSWAKGTARKDSDIDMIALFEGVDRKISRDIEDIKEKFEEIGCERSLTLLPVSIEDFKKERLPLYTAIKKEGIILYGNADLSINPEKPEKKYREFFERSKEWESEKVKIAEELILEHPGHSSADLCFIAAKHAIQAGLAMKGVGYSSKVSVLLPLVKEHYGNLIADAFKRLFELYIKSEYTMDFLTQEEASECVALAKEILKVCYRT